ncbi:hypothetical protein MTR_3g056090 [Medicago truncatula]|uniref:Uncharacterized protein n=1 Tax=Medicago truncatula TaxID=3880 RepID=G7J208_MEDTR|nr:hypothetical protein MTR_3g056090 [Medicago truncatula]
MLCAKYQLYVTLYHTKISEEIGAELQITFIKLKSLWHTKIGSIKGLIQIFSSS